MRRFLLFPCILLGSLTLSAQTTETLKVREFTLSNGMKVYLNEDHSRPKVYGAVVVNAGSNDCPDTGIAHYFEHMMFKGTTRLGTTDYAAEKVYLDSITVEYDRLAATRDGAERAAIQKTINRLSGKAAAYAIPNEFDRLISRFGGSGLNAGTSYDYTVYYNTFIPGNLAPWCELYTERLRHPVFRLFQNELETVYEEKNMYSDQLGALSMERAVKEYFGDTPYGCPIIGTTEHLKNPQLSQMAAFFRKYYVPANMAVILCGDLDAEASLPVLARTFGTLKGDPAPAREPIKPEPFQGRRVARIKVPVPLVKIGVVGFRAPLHSDPDYMPLSVAVSLLSNSSGSGLLDSLGTAHKMLAAFAFNESLDDAGILAFGYVPNLPFGSSAKAEKLCWEQIRRVQTGDFSEKTLEELKANLRRDSFEALEDISGRGSALTSLFTQGRTWEDYIAQLNGIASITRADVMRVAEKYFTSDHLKLVKKFGNYPKDKVEQPGYTPVTPPNAHASSAYADSLAAVPTESAAPRLLDYDQDLETMKLGDLATLYTVRNPVNDIFSLELIYHKGTFDDPLLAAVSEYLSSVGTDSLSSQACKKALQRLGARFSTSSDQRSFTLTLSGPEENFEEAVTLMRHFMDHAVADKKSTKELVQSCRLAGRTFEKDNRTVARAVSSRVIFGKNSTFLRQPDWKEIKKAGGETLTDIFKALQENECSIVYTGTRSTGEVAALVSRHLPVEKAKVDRDAPLIAMTEVREPTVYLYDLPSSRQNILMTWQNVAPLGSDADEAKLRLWSEYFGSGMFSILFQEIREFRSFAYAVSGYPRMPIRKFRDAPTGFCTFIGTQADKTSDALRTLDSLFRNMPMREANAMSARQTILNEINNSYPSFREAGSTVAFSRFNGCSANPEREIVKILPELTSKDIREYYDAQIKGRPQVLMVVGDKKKLPMEQLKRFGRIVELEKKDVYR